MRAVDSLALDSADIPVETSGLARLAENAQVPKHVAARAIRILVHTSDVDRRVLSRLFELSKLDRDAMIAAVGR